MEFSTDMLMDVALNAIGYLAAGALSVTLYSLVAKRRRQADQPTPEAAKPDSSETAATDPASRSVEFVRFGESQSIEKPARQDSAKYRRNRLEVIGMARKMIDSGTPMEEIKDLLPISDAELALLCCDNS